MNIPNERFFLIYFKLLMIIYFIINIVVLQSVKCFFFIIAVPDMLNEIFTLMGVRILNLNFVCDSNGEDRNRRLSGCSTDSVTAVTSRRVSWRQKIFLRVASPMNKASVSMHKAGV